MITLYDYELSGNCYKLRLFMSCLGLEYRQQLVDFYPGKAHKSAAFLRINPLGQLPVLDDDGLVLRDAQAILCYLATQYDGSGEWFPKDDPVRLGQVMQWLAFADAITTSASAARLHDGLNYVEIDIAAVRDRAHALFRVLDEHLFFAEEASQMWICPGKHPTIADIACFPYIALSEEGGISRLNYPAIRRWCDRVKRISGFIPMSGIFLAGPGPSSASTPAE